MEDLHTHAHKTQTYWPSQANNKLIWAISALCGGTKQRDQTGAAASSLRWGPHLIFFTPVASPSWLGEGWTPGKECQVQLASLHLWHPAHNRADTRVEAAREMEKCLFCYNKRQYLALVYFIQWIITVWFDMVSTVTTPPTPTPDKFLLPPPPCLSKKPPVRHMCRSNYAPNRTFREGRDHSPSETWWN